MSSLADFVPSIVALSIASLTILVSKSFKGTILLINYYNQYITRTIICINNIISVITITTLIIGLRVVEFQATIFGLAFVSSFAFLTKHHQYSEIISVYKGNNNSTKFYLY